MLTRACNKSHLAQEGQGPTTSCQRAIQSLLQGCQPPVVSRVLGSVFHGTGSEMLGRKPCYCCAPFPGSLAATCHQSTCHQ